MRATIRDLARMTGLSTSTVSRVVTSNPHVSADARRRVEQAIAETAYVPNGLARGLAVRRRNVLAVVLPIDADHPLYGEIFAGIADMAARNNYSLIHISQSMGDSRDAVERILEVGVDGIIHMGPLADDKVIPLLARSETPFVMLNRWYPGVPCSMVLSDDHEAARIATEHLLSLGHRRIAYLYASHQSSSSREKYRGYLSALRAHSIQEDPGLFAVGGLSIDTGRKAAEHLLAERAAGRLSFTAILGGNDLIALGAREAVLARGLRIPEDISIVGMDDIRYCALQGIGLTSVAPQKREMGRAACRLLIRRITHPESPFQREMLRPRLMIRNSTCAPKEQRI